MSGFEFDYFISEVIGESNRIAGISVLERFAQRDESIVGVPVVGGGRDDDRGRAFRRRVFGICGVKHGGGKIEDVDVGRRGVRLVGGAHTGREEFAAGRDAEEFAGFETFKA